MSTLPGNPVKSTRTNISDDRNMITQLGGNFKGVFEIALADIVYGNRHQPVRASGEDKENSRQIASSILNKGMMVPERAPTVKWDAGLCKWKPNDGNHRLQACEEIANVKGIELAKYKVPVAVVDWGTNLVGENEYSHRANNGNPRKLGTRRDAELMLFQQHGLGRFNGLSNKEMQTEAYKLIDKNFSSCCSPASKSTIWKNFKQKIGMTKVNQYNKKALSKEAIRHWNLPATKFKSGGITNGVCRIANTPANVFKMLPAVFSKEPNGTTDVHCLVYSISETAKSIKTERANTLKTLALYNRRLWQPNTIQVKEVTFLPQIQTGPNFSNLEMIKTYHWKTDSSDKTDKWFDVRAGTFLSY